MSDLEVFAQWIAANQDKKGTPEFAEVAQAFRHLDRQSKGVGPQPMDVPTPEPSMLARIGRGYMDIAQGTKQKYLNMTDPAAAADYTKQVSTDIGDYEKNLQSSGFEGVDWARTTGQAAPFMAIPGGQKDAGLRFLTGAGMAGAQSYLNFDESGSDDWKQTALNAGIGGTVNTAVPWLLDNGVQGVQWAGNKLAEGLRRGAQAVSPRISNEITVNLKAELANRGIDWDGLGDRLRTAMTKDAQEQMAISGKLDPDALLRKADIEAVAPGMATKAQITHSPRDWTIERNLQKTDANLPAVKTGEMESLTGRYAAQDAARGKYAEGIRDDLYGQSVNRAETPYQASEQAAAAVKSQYEAEGKAISKMYENIRTNHGDKFGMTADNLMKSVDELRDIADADPIIASVVRKMQKIGLLDKNGAVIQRARSQSALTANQAEELRKFIGGLEKTSPTRAMAVGRLVNALDEDVAEGARLSGLPEDVFGPARAAAKARFQKYGAKPLQDLLQDGDTSKFFSRYVTNGNPKELSAALRVMPDEARANIKANAWGLILDKATQGGKNPLTGAALARELRKIGKDRLGVLFSKSELAQIETLKRAALAMTDAPAHSAVNHSNTGAMLVGQLMRYGNAVPGVSQMVTRPIMESMEASAQQKLLSQALNAEGVNRGAIDIADAEMRKKLVQMLGRINPGAAAVAGVGTMQQ